MKQEFGLGYDLGKLDGRGSLQQLIWETFDMDSSENETSCY